MEAIQTFLKEYPALAEAGKLVGILLVSILVYLITSFILFRTTRVVFNQLRSDYGALLFSRKVIRRISIIPSLIAIRILLTAATPFDAFIATATDALFVIAFINVVAGLLMAFNDVYEKKTKRKRRSIKGYLQVANIILYILGAIIVISILTGRESLELFAGLGAMTALLMLIFKDTILSFIASVQLNSYDMVRIGDWIEMPAYGVDGDVIDISLHTIKVRNFDATVSTLPTHKLVEGSFKNWRAMKEAGGRRIKRAILIDQSSIKFCDEKLLDKFGDFELLKSYLSSKSDEIDAYNKKRQADTSQLINGRHLTNVGTFRAYAERYLQSRSDINKDLISMIRQLPPGPEGLPIEIYTFTSETEWVKYEDIQADIFDHLLAVIPEFELRVFQAPGGADLQSLRSGSNE